jgi:hypothetical protein
LTATEPSGVLLGKAFREEHCIREAIMKKVNFIAVAGASLFSMTSLASTGSTLPPLEYVSEIDINNDNGYSTTGRRYDGINLSLSNEGSTGYTITKSTHPSLYVYASSADASSTVNSEDLLYYYVEFFGPTPTVWVNIQAKGNVAVDNFASLVGGSLVGGSFLSITGGDIFAHWSSNTTLPVPFNVNAT